MQRIALLYLFFYIATSAVGQNFDSTLYLHPVEISAFRYQSFSFANHQEIMDSNILTNAVSKNLSQLLNEQSSLFVKSYGTQSATLSCRGTGTAHNLIAWNGIPLTNPMLGLSDISLIPIQFFNYVTLSMGNNCTLEGSGATGSYIDLGVKPIFNTGTTITATKTIGSFGLNYTGLGLATHSSDFFTSIQAFHKSSTNNFRFENFSQLHSPVQELTNNAVQDYGLTTDIFYKLKTNQVLSLHGWLQNDDRQIPPTMLQYKSLAEQKDLLKRMAASWEGESVLLKWSLKSAWSDETLDYRDPLTNLVSIGKFSSWISISEIHFNLNKNLHLSAGINNTYTTAFTNEYKKERTRNTVAIYTAISYQPKNDWLHIGVTARQCFQDVSSNPLIGSLSLEEKITPSFSVTQMVATTYRTPTLNDLYWVPGGNENLNPESGWNADVGFRYNKSFHDFRFTVSDHVFSYFLNNLIVWQPGKSGFWSPQNVNSVWSRGNELEGKLNYKVRYTEFQFRLAGCYTLATNETENTVAATLHNQLPYTPELIIRSSISLDYHNWNLCYSHSFTSLTYLTSDNKQYLPEYDLPGIHLSKKIFIQGSNQFLEAGIDIYNVSNTSYQVIAYRPMPGRNFEFTFKLTI